MHFRIFESWRLAAALLVMNWHFLRFAPPGHETASAFIFRLMPLMEMFFMISGFLIMFRYADTLGRERGAYRRFIVRRLSRFYPLYLVTLLFFVGVGVAVQMGVVHSDDPGRYDFSTLPANLLLLQAWGFTHELTFNYVSWSMSAEWFCYLALPVIVLAFRYGGMAGLAALAVAAVLLLETGTRTGVIPFDTWLHANTWGAFRAFADFAIGALVAMAARGTRLKLRSHWPAWVLFAVSVTAMLTQQDAYVIVALLAAALFCAALCERDNPAGSQRLALLHPLGKVSMGIYLLHPMVEAVLFAILWGKVLEPSGLFGFYTFWFVPMAVTIGLAMLSDRFFEPRAADWMMRLFGGKKRPAAVAEEAAQPA